MCVCVCVYVSRSGGMFKNDIILLFVTVVMPNYKKYCFDYLRTRMIRKWKLTIGIVVFIAIYLVVLKVFDFLKYSSYHLDVVLKSQQTMKILLTDVDLHPEIP